MKGGWGTCNFSPYSDPVRRFSIEPSLEGLNTKFSALWWPVSTDFCFNTTGMLGSINGSKMLQSVSL